MASSNSRFSDKNYLNWLSGTLSLLYVKEGIEHIVEEEAVRFHTNIQQSLGLHNTAPQICFLCTSRNITKDFRRHMWHMPCAVCNPWLQQIIQNHADYASQPIPKIWPENTDPQLWPSCPFEVMKAYMPYGCKSNQSAKDGDAQGIFSLIKSCNHFTSCGRIGRMDLIDDLLDLRNSLFHSGTFLIDDTSLKAAQQIMLDFLGGLWSLSLLEQQSVDQAVEKITQLKQGTLDLSLNRELELLALQQKQIAIDSEVRTLQKDLASVLIKTTSNETDIKTLAVQKTQLAKVETDLKNLQKDHTSVSAQTTSNETDIKTLTAKTRVLAEVESEVNTIQENVASVLEKTTKLEQHIQKLHTVRDSFNRFVKANGLDQDLTRLSTTVDHNSQKIQNLETQTQDLNKAIVCQKDEISTLYQRQEATNKELQARLKDSQDHGNQLLAQQRDLDTQQSRLHDVEAKLKQQTQAGNETKDLTDEDITELSAFLRKYYRTMLLTIPNPLVSEEIGLDRMYVNPDIKVLRETTDPLSGLVNVQDRYRFQYNYPLECKEMFYTKKYKCKQIYVTGDAGIGKSILCKHLVDLWCKADNNTTNDTISSEENDSDQKMEDNIGIMADFKLLFYITLRNSPTQYHIADMIDSQILQEIEETQHLKASLLLKKVCCLVVVDGLDEWICPKDAKVPRNTNPGIPGRYFLNENNVFLTTTRPWKFDVLQLTSKEVDKHIELVGLNYTSIDELTLKMIKLKTISSDPDLKIRNDFQAEIKKKGLGHLCNIPVILTQLIRNDFQAEIKKKGLGHLCNIPVILTQLICLWFDNQDLGKSQLQLYCSILEMLLKRAAKNLPEETSISSSKTANKEKLLPKCFLNLQHCQTHQHLIISLCKVAFKALFNSKQEHSLVFESSQMEILGVDQNNIKLCLKSGILSQSKVIGKWSISEKKLSFLHKKVQEFLAAIFIACCQKVEYASCISYVKRFCTSVDTMLEMSQVWMFVSGIRPHLAEQLLTYMMTDIVLHDTRLQQSRHNMYTTDSDFARSIQTCILDCVVEARSNVRFDMFLPLEDFVISQETISTYCLESLLKSNKTSVKSIYIFADEIRRETLERILCQVQGIRCLQGFYLYNPFSVRFNMELLYNILDNNINLTSLVLQVFQLTDASSDAFLEMEGRINRPDKFNATSQPKKKEFETNRANYECELYWHCLRGRPRPRIDLSGHLQLHTIVLWCMTIEYLPAMKHCVNDVRLWDVRIEECRLRKFIHELSFTPHTVKVDLDRVIVKGESDSHVDLTDLEQNAKLVVTLCHYYDVDDTWSIMFHTLQQQTPNGSDCQLPTLFTIIDDDTIRNTEFNTQHQQMTIRSDDQIPSLRQKYDDDDILSKEFVTQQQPTSFDDDDMLSTEFHNNQQTTIETDNKTSCVCTNCDDDEARSIKFLAQLQQTPTETDIQTSCLCTSFDGDDNSQQTTIETDNPNSSLCTRWCLII